MKDKAIAIINYGMGNVHSVGHALERLDGEYFITNAPADLEAASAFILPGVGAFGAAMDNLDRLGLSGELGRQVLEKGKPFLGICLGMQVLAQDSVELGFHAGLGWLEAHVLEMRATPDCRLPHVGWNTVRAAGQCPLFRGIPEESHFYFDHSFHLRCGASLTAGTSDHGGEFAAAVWRDNILATQFHPEKSQRSGLKMLRNFLNFIASN